MRNVKNCLLSFFVLVSLVGVESDAVIYSLVRFGHVVFGHVTAIRVEEGGLAQNTPSRI
jgi:hypothetical protein